MERDGHAEGLLVTHHCDSSCAHSSTHVLVEAGGACVERCPHPDHREHGRAYGGVGPDEGGDRGAYCDACSAAVQDYVWPCRLKT